MAKNNFPSFNEYQAVLQSPAHCFNTPELKFSAVETDLWGLPRVRSGGFALTYKLHNRVQQLAVRCFHRFVPDRAQRYSAISTFLTTNPSDIFIPIRFLMNGVLVRGNWYPITYMKWVEGDTLEAYLVKNVQNTALMQNLGAEFLRVVAELERLGVAHGDLSHRNILVHNGKIVLVDYDGMFVPTLQGRKSSEIGNVHFQLPGRSEVHFNPHLDRFSAIVIHLGLRALSLNPALLGRYETGGEGLMFRRDDFLNPYQSVLLQELENLPEMHTPINQFRQICTSEMGMVPRLADFIAGRPLDVPRREIPVAPPPQTPVFDANFRTRLLAREGKLVTVVGKVSEIFRGTSKDGTPHVFLNMGYWRLKCFTIVLWDGALQLYEASQKNPDDYQDRWLSVTGMLTTIVRRPQIMINSPTDIQMLGSEEEARQMLGLLPNIPPGSPERPPAPRPAPDKDRRPTPPAANSGQPPATSATSRVQGSLDQTREVLARIEKLFASFNQPKT